MPDRQQQRVGTIDAAGDANDTVVVLAAAGGFARRDELVAVRLLIRHRLSCRFEFGVEVPAVVADAVSVESDVCRRGVHDTAGADLIASHVERVRRLYTPTQNLRRTLDHQWRAEAQPG